MHGQFTWYELSTSDVDAARKFYPKFTSWGTMPFDKDYLMWTTGGVPLAGIFRMTDAMRAQGVPPNWMPYVESNDVDATASRASASGGKVVVGPDDIPNMGRYAVIQDPQGAVFGVYKSNAPSGGWDGNPVLSRFSWHELMTTDYGKAAEFYGSLFGWKKTGEMDMGGGQMYFMFGEGERMYGGMFNTPAEMAGMPPFWLCYIHVEDVGKAVATATRNGATVHRERMEIPGGTIAILADPQGAAFAVHDLKPMPASAPASGGGAAGKSDRSKKASGGTSGSTRTVAAKKAIAKKGKALGKAAKKTVARAGSALRKAASKLTRKKRPNKSAGTRKKQTAGARRGAGRTVRKTTARKQARRASGGPRMKSAAKRSRRSAARSPRRPARRGGRRK